MRRPCWQHGPNSQSSKLNLVLRLSMRNGRFHAHLAAGVGILSTTMALVAAVLGLLVGEEQAYAVSTLKDKDGGSEKPRKYSSAAHDSTLSCRASPCQIARQSTAVRLDALGPQPLSGWIATLPTQKAHSFLLP